MPKTCKFEVGHWYTFRQINGSKIIGRYVGRDPENCCSMLGHKTDKYNAHKFEVWYKQHGKLVEDGECFCDECLPDIIEDLGDSKEIIVFADLD